MIIRSNDGDLVAKFPSLSLSQAATLFDNSDTRKKYNEMKCGTITNKAPNELILHAKSLEYCNLVRDHGSSRNALRETKIFPALSKILFLIERERLTLFQDFVNSILLLNTTDTRNACELRDSDLRSHVTQLPNKHYGP